MYVSHSGECRECGLVIDSGQLCEFCAERHRQETARGVRKADKVRVCVPVKGGHRGQGYGCGGQGVTLDERDFFGDGYNVAVAADIDALIGNAPTEAEDVAAGNPGAEDVVPEGDGEE